MRTCAIYDGACLLNIHVFFYSCINCVISIFSMSLFEDHSESQSLNSHPFNSQSTENDTFLTELYSIMEDWRTKE